MLLRPAIELRVYFADSQDCSTAVLPSNLPSKAFSWVLYGIGTFLLLFLLSSLLTSALQCLPVPSFWHPSEKHHCIDQVKFYIVQGSLNFVSDLFVVLMPMPILWRLHLPAGRKWKLLVLFLLGGL